MNHTARGLITAITAFSLSISSFAAITDLKITEVMYHAAAETPVPGDSLDFVEFKNTGVDPIDLSAVAFAEGIEFAFPSGFMLAAGDFAVIANDSVSFHVRYPLVPVAGQYLGALRNSGERLTVVNGNDTLISFRYNDNLPWPVLADGNGWSIVPVETNPTTTLEQASEWRASAAVNGSPGADDGTPPSFADIQITEFLSHTDLPETDGVELYNASAGSVDVSGWYLSDTRTDPKKYEFPSGSVIAAGGYLTILEPEFNDGSATAFSLNRSGDWVFLFSADAAHELTGFVTGYDFGPQFNGTSFGTYLNSEGETHLVAQASVTLGAENSYPKIGPLVFSKIFYHPASGTEEFVAVKNITNAPIDLWSSLSADTTWEIGGIGFQFPTGVTIDGGEEVFVTNFNVEVFRNTHLLPFSTQIFQFSGALNNDGELLEIRAPDNFDTTATGSVWAPMVVIDAVRYNDASPWPTSPDGGGAYLERITMDEYGNDPINWQASSDPVGLAPLEATGDITVWPNPASSELWVEMAAQRSSVLRIVDIHGKLVWEGMQNGLTNRIDVSGFASGVYVLRAVEGTHQTSVRFVVE